MKTQLKILLHYSNIFKCTFNIFSPQILSTVTIGGGNKNCKGRPSIQEYIRMKRHLVRLVPAKDWQSFAAHIIENRHFQFTLGRERGKYRKKRMSNSHKQQRI